MFALRRLRRFTLPLVILCASSSSAWSSGELRMRLPTDPATLDWNLAHTSHETYVLMNLMEGLVEEGENLQPRPALAESWTISPDRKTYTFTLRPGVQWSDGQPLKASDFVASWLRLLSPKLDATYANFLFDVENAEAFHSGRVTNPARVGVRALGDSRLQVKLREPIPYFLHLLTFWVTYPVRTDVITKGGRDWAVPGKIVTLGPYTLQKWERGKSLQLAKNARYYDRAALNKAPDSVSLLIDADDKSSRRLFDAGKIDFLLGAKTEDVLKAQNQEDTKGGKQRVEQFPYLATYYLAFNVLTPPVKDVNVRKAIGLALDISTMPAVLQAGQVPAKGWIPPGMNGHASGAALRGTVYDARGALSKAGYPEGRGFPSITLWMEKFDGAETLSKHIVSTLSERLGIKVEPRITPPAEYRAALRARKAALFVQHWGADYPDPSNFFEVFLSKSPTNWVSWANPEYDKLVIKARTAEGEARLKLYAAAERLLLQKEVTIVPLYHNRNAVLLGSRVKKLFISPLNYLFFKDVELQ